MEEQVISISEILEALKKRWKLIVSITILATLISGVISFFVIQPEYETSVKVFIGKEEGTDQAYNNSDITMYQQLLKTYAQTIQTKDLINEAIDNTEYDISAETVLQSLVVTPIDSTQILEMKYTSQNQQAATDILEEIANEFIILSQELVSNGNIRIIEEVQFPESPISPNKAMNIIIAAMLGVMVGVGIVFLLEYMDNTYKNKENLEKELNIPVLAVITEA